jgi:hypothetical protein
MKLPSQEMRTMLATAISRRFLRIPIRTRGSEPSIAEMLSDSIVIAMMRADRVDPKALEATLRGMAKQTSHSTSRRCAESVALARPPQS